MPPRWVQTGMGSRKDTFPRSHLSLNRCPLPLYFCVCLRVCVLSYEVSVYNFIYTR